MTPSGGRWHCCCDCGRMVTVRGTDLLSGHNASCGCLARDTTIARSKTHGHALRGMMSPTYVTWCLMRQRCANLKSPQYKWYGKRGIKVCDRWLDAFENFLADMGERPTGMSLDRVDPNGNYEPANCRWATPREQSNNTRRSRWITHNGETLTVAQFARKFNLPHHTLYKRLFYRKWDVERALTTPCPRQTNGGPDDAISCGQ